jgi:hypothetical protein
LNRFQEYLHRFEVGEGARFLRGAVLLLGLVLLAAAYDSQEFRNLATSEAMDAAQVARNLADGEGFTTKFIRPLSLHLLETRAASAGGGTNDPARLRGPHPDLANPPVYPLMLAGVMKILPFNHDLATKAVFRIHQPDLLIALVNQALFFLAVVLAFRLAKRLFDSGVAWVTALALLGSELLWRFTVSGLSTPLLLVITLALAGCLVSADRTPQDTPSGRRRVVRMAGLAGLVVGVGALTRYSFGWLILPVMGFFALGFPAQRRTLPLVAWLAFSVVFSPWLARNFHYSGTLFGTAGYAVVEGTPAFSAHSVERFLSPDLSQVTIENMGRKLLVNLGGVLFDDAPRLGGSLLTAFFLVGLMVSFVTPGLRRLRWFVLGALATLAVAQALGRTPRSTLSPQVNSENLLVLLAPLVLMYGAALFFLLLDQLKLPFIAARRWVIGLFVTLLATPLILALLPPRADPRVLPPYYPPLIQQFAGWLGPDELMMSDLPWAVAWYGHQRCVWTTLHVRSDRGGEDFYAINDLRRPIAALYLTQLTLDEPLFSQLYRDSRSAQKLAWGRFVSDCVLRNDLPTGFPLQHAPFGYLERGHFLLADRARWLRVRR